MTLSHAQFQDWLDRYVAAWKSYDRDEIAALFSHDAEYRYHPDDEPVRGAQAIAADWADAPDPPGSFDAHYEPLAIDPQNGNHVSSGWSRYFQRDGSVRDVYWNIYRCTFDDQGRCTSFTEWYIRGREYEKAHLERVRAEAVEKERTGAA